VRRAAWWLLVLLAVTLLAAGYESELRYARSALASANKARIWKGYHTFQSLYMKGLLDKDRALQIQSLHGLIDASEKLGLDPTRYRNALRALQPYKSYKSQKKRKQTIHSAPTSKKSRIAARAGSSTMLHASKIENGRLVLTFREPVRREQIRKNLFKQRLSNLYVFDFDGVRLPYSIKRFKGRGFKEVRIGQFHPKKMRVVVETTNRYQPVCEVEGRQCFITLPGTSTKKHPSFHIVQKKRPVAKPKSAAAAGSTKKSRDIKRPVVKKAAPKKVERKHAVTPVASAGSVTYRDYTVVIDPGHGGKDAGAVGVGRRKEKDAVLAVAKEVVSLLRRRGFHVYMTRSTDRFISLKHRTRMANRRRADIFVSIHANAAPRRSAWPKHKGLETYFLSPARSGRAKRVAAIENRAEIKNIDRYTKEAYLSVLNREKIIASNKLAIDLQRQILASLRTRYRDIVDNGVREGPFWVLVGAQMPAVLVEIGYITHPVEGKRLFSKRYRQLLAVGIANGIESYILHNR